MTLGIVFILFLSLLALGLLGSIAIIRSARFGRRFASTVQVGPGRALSGTPRLLDSVSSLTFGRVRSSPSERTRPLFRGVSMASTIEPEWAGVTLKDPENFKPGRRP